MNTLSFLTSYLCYMKHLLLLEIFNKSNVHISSFTNIKTQIISNHVLRIQNHQITFTPQVNHLLLFWDNHKTNITKLNEVCLHIITIVFVKSGYLLTEPEKYTNSTRVDGSFSCYKLNKI